MGRIDLDDSVGDFRSARRGHVWNSALSGADTSIRVYYYGNNLVQGNGFTTAPMVLMAPRQCIQSNAFPPAFYAREPDYSTETVPAFLYVPKERRKDSICCNWFLQCGV
jgi:hypothetical protein